MSSKNRSQQGSRPKSRTARHGEQQKVVGSYMIGKTVGEGTFGKVKLAVHIPTGEKVAVKILEKSRIKDQADVRRVNREIKILKKAKNSNIIQLYEVIDTSTAIYLIMENADGGELFDYIVQNRHVAEMQACKFFHQLIDGVEALHRYEITHRDLKPENLLLKNSPHGLIVKIVDFGLSNTHEGGKLLATACGSPCYAAPEMIAGHKYFGPLADIWSIGVILFALVCGYLPFEDPNTSALYKKILSGEYKPAKWISNDVKDLIRKILEVDPKKRYTVEHIKRHPWYNMISEASIPKDLAHESSTSAEFRKETLVSVDQAGFDAQAVSDAVSSNSCNSLSALYYLFEQKLYATRSRAEAPTSVSLHEADAKHIVAPVITGGNLDRLEPPTIPLLEPLPPLQPLHPPPQRLRPVPLIGGSPVVELSVGPAADENVVSPRIIPPIIAKPPVPRNYPDRHNWRLRGFRAQPEQEVIDPLSVVSTKAVLQNKENPATSGGSSPRNRPTQPPANGVKSPRKVITDDDVSGAGARAHNMDPLLKNPNPAAPNSYETTPIDRENSDKENEIVANPPPDEMEASSERPSTRRSHLRTPGRTTRPNTAEYGEFGEATIQPDEIVFMDQLSASIPFSMLSIDRTPIVVDEDEVVPSVNIRAPEAPKSSQPQGAGGRRGKHIRQTTNDNGADEDIDKGDDIRGVTSVAQVAAVRAAGSEAVVKPRSTIISTLGNRLLAPVSKPEQISARDAAAQFKAQQKGSLVSSPGGIVVSS